MKFTFTEKKMDSSEELRAYAIRKISKLDRFFKTEAEAYVTFSVSRGRFLAEITIEAQTYARALYERCGFRQTSEEFLEDGIPHIQMQLKL